MLEHIASDDDALSLLVAGSICKDFSSMGDGKRLVGRHVPHLQVRAVMLSPTYRCKASQLVDDSADKIAKPLFEAC